MQAEATIDVFFKFMEYNFATKEDLHGIHRDLVSIRETLSAIQTEVSSIRTELRLFQQEMRQFRDETQLSFTEIHHRMQSLEYKMTIKFGLMQAAGIGILTAILKLT